MLKLSTETLNLLNKVITSNPTLTRKKTWNSNILGIHILNCLLGVLGIFKKKNKHNQ